MKKLLFLLVLICFALSLGCYGDYGEKKASKTSDSGDSAVSLPEGPLALPEGANSEASMHNEAETGLNRGHEGCPGTEARLYSDAEAWLHGPKRHVDNRPRLDTQTSAATAPAWAYGDRGHGTLLEGQNMLHRHARRLRAWT